MSVTAAGTKKRARNSKSSASQADPAAARSAVPPPLWPERDVELAKITAEAGDNHRIGIAADRAAIDSLKASMAAFGLMHPVMVRPASVGYELVYGFRRVTAARELGWLSIRAKVAAGLAENLVEAYRLGENLQRQDLSPMEQALGVLALLKTPEIAGDVGKAAALAGVTVQWINDRRYLERLGPKVQTLLLIGKLGVEQAREIAKLGDRAAQLTVAGQCYTESEYNGHTVFLSAKKTRELVEAQQHQLKLVPWELHLPIWGKPACIGCPDNTASDAVLFDVAVDEDTAGRCMNPACFEHKKQKTEEAKAKLVEKLQKHKLGPTAANVRAMAPEGVKLATMERFAKAQLTPAAAGEGKKPAKEAAPARRTPKAIAEEKLGVALDKWGQVAESALRAAAVASPERLAAASLFEMTGPGSNLARRAWTDDQRREQEKAMRHSQVAWLLAADWQQIARAVEGNYEVPLLTEAPGAFLEILARGWQVELPPLPRLEDFLRDPKAKAKAKAEGKIVGGEVYQPQGMKRVHPAELGLKAGDLTGLDLVSASSLLEKPARASRVLTTATGSSYICVAGGENYWMLYAVRAAGDSDAGLADQVPVGGMRAATLIIGPDKRHWVAYPSVLGAYELAYPEGQCRYCGCTEDRACVGGCSWVDKAETICSRCGNAVATTLGAKPAPRRKAKSSAAARARAAGLNPTASQLGTEDADTEE